MCFDTNRAWTATAYTLHIALRAVDEVRCAVSGSLVHGAERAERARHVGLGVADDEGTGGRTENDDEFELLPEYSDNCPRGP